MIIELSLSPLNLLTSIQKIGIPSLPIRVNTVWLVVNRTTFFSREEWQRYGFLALLQSLNELLC